MDVSHWSPAPPTQHPSNGVYFYAGQGEYCGYYRWSYAQYVQYANDYVYFSENHDYYWGYSRYAATVRDGIFVVANQSVQSRFVVQGADGVSFGGEMNTGVQSYPINYTWNYNDGSYVSYGWQNGVQVYGYGSGITTP